MVCFDTKLAFINLKQAFITTLILYYINLKYYFLKKINAFDKIIK